MKTSIGKIFEEYPNPCLWLSGGADSLLLLRMMLAFGEQFAVLRFDDAWNREQRKQTDEIIRRHNLMVFSYPPVLSLLAEENGEVAWITSYAVDRFGTPALLVKDLVEDPQRCCFDIKVDLSQTAAAQIEFDAHIWGTRREDRHWLAGDNDLASKRWQIGSKQFFAPLYEWTRDEVIEALTIFEETAPAADTGNVTCCSRCLMKSETGQVFCPKAEKDIPVVEWDREENLKFVRTILRSNK